MFSLKHIFWFILLLVIWHLIVKYIDEKNFNTELFLKILTAYLIADVAVKTIYENYTGSIDWSNALPLYICSLFLFLIPILTLSAKDSLMYKISASAIMSICFVSGFGGFIFNSNLAHHPFWSYLVIRALLYHSLMILTPIILVKTNYIIIKADYYYYNLISMAAIGIVAYIVDLYTGYDYFYFNGGVDTVYIYVSRVLGIPLFLILNNIMIYAGGNQAMYLIDVHLSEESHTEKPAEIIKAKVTNIYR